MHIFFPFLEDHSNSTYSRTNSTYSRTNSTYSRKSDSIGYLNILIPPSYFYRSYKFITITLQLQLQLLYNYLNLLQLQLQFIMLIIITFCNKVEIRQEPNNEVAAAGAYWNTLAPVFIGARYFLIKSNNIENIMISKVCFALTSFETWMRCSYFFRYALLDFLFCYFHSLIRRRMYGQHCLKTKRDSIMPLR